MPLTIKLAASSASKLLWVIWHCGQVQIYAEDLCRLRQVEPKCWLID